MPEYGFDIIVAFDAELEVESGVGPGVTLVKKATVCRKVAPFPNVGLGTAVR